MYMKTKELGWKDNYGIQDTGINDSEGNIIADKEPDCADGKCPYILRSEVDKDIKE
jgi:hypothetical protein